MDEGHAHEERFHESYYRFIIETIIILTKNNDDEVNHLSDPILKVEHMSKNYGKFLALNDFNCEIQPGVTGLLGPNGAGKTTFIRSLLGIIPFEEGKIQFLEWILPRDLMKARDFIGYQPEIETKLLRTSAIQYVTLIGKLSGLPRQAAIQRAFDVLHYVGLEEARYRDLMTFSTGMLQRVKLAAALVNDPTVLILDEPTAGMDPMGRNQMLELIKDLGKNHGKHVILSTHLLPDVERTCDNVVVIANGKNVFQGSIKNLLDSPEQEVPYQLQISGDLKAFIDALKDHGFKAEIEDTHFISCWIPRDDLQLQIKIFKIAKSLKVTIRTFRPYRKNLEGIFIELLK